MPTDRPRKSDIYVVRTPNGWALKRSGATRAAGTYRTQAEAVQAAQEKLSEKGGELRVQGSDGRWRDSFTVGRDSIGKMNEVEGIHISREMKGAFREFDRQGLSAEERRKAIARTFSKKG